MRIVRSVSFLLLSAAFCAVGLGAQSVANLPRIQGPVESGRVTELRGNVTYLAQTGVDLGTVPVSTQLGRLRLVLTRSAAQEAALDAYLAQLQDKSSPNYHKWLTPEQFGRMFGPADSDIAAIVAWLQSRGLTTDVPPGRAFVAFSGTVGQVQDAFGISIHSFSAHGQEFTANTSNPRIPAALASIVSGVSGLNTFRPRAHSVAGRAGFYDSEKGRLAPATPSGNGLHTDLTGGKGTTASPYTLYLVPGDAATIYDTPNTTFNANYTTGTTYDGTGVTIGIGGDAPILQTTAAAYRTQFLGNSTQPTVSYCTTTTPISCSTSAATAGVTNTGDTDEAYIDNELSGGLAPGATIHYYASSDLFSGIEQALADNTVDIFSLSFGLCELIMDSADNASINTMWKQAAGQGIAVTVSTGDSGSAVCDDPNSETTATYGLQVSGFASTPYNIAVGGTDLVGLLSGYTTYAGTTNSAATYFRTATKYIPEATWNDSVLTDGTIANNQAFTYVNSKNVTVTEIVGGSGGASQCSTNTTTYSGNNTILGNCTGGYAKPAWQRGTGVPSDKVRDLPDISLMAGDGSDNAAWTVCTDDTTTNSANQTVSLNCQKQVDGNFYINAFGGTSTAAPAFAGILALVQQKSGSRLGQAATELYDLYNGSNAASIFHDIITGNNSVPCTSGTPNCTKNTKSEYFESGYDTNTGYDLATGIGSVDVANLVKYWGTGTGATSPTITLTPSATTVQPGQGDTVAVTVTGTLGTPIGTVTLSSGSYKPASATLSGGAYTFTIPAGSLAFGTDTVSVAYSGDENYAPGTQTASITVLGIVPTVTATASPTAIESSQTVTVTGTVSGSSGTPTGSVTVSGGGYTSSAQALSAGAYTLTIPANSLSAGTDTLTVNYSGDTIYQSGAATATVTVTASVFTMSASSPAAVSAGGSATSTVTVTTSTGYAGTVTLACALTSSPTGAVNTPTCSASGASVTLSNSTTSGTATVTVSTTAATAMLQQPRGGWMKAGGGMVLALIVFFGIPSRRKSWRAMLGALILLVTLGSLSACGGGGSSGGGGSKGTTAGSYTFTVTGTGTPAETPAPTTTFTLTVN